MQPEIRQLIQRGRHSFDRRNYADALAAFRQVLSENPNFADIRHLTGLCLGFLGQPEEALVQFDAAIRLNASYVEAHLNRAIILTELGRYEEAHAAFQEAGRHETLVQGQFPALVSARLANAHAAVGDLYLEASAPEQAAEQYRTALTMRSKFHDIRHKLAQALIQLGQLEAARDELELVLDGNPRFLSARLNLGLVYYRLGDPKRASQEWKNCREQQPDNPQVRAYIAMIERQAPAA